MLAAAAAFVSVAFLAAVAVARVALVLGTDRLSLTTPGLSPWIKTWKEERI